MLSKHIQRPLKMITITPKSVIILVTTVRLHFHTGQPYSQYNTTLFRFLFFPLNFTRLRRAVWVRLSQVG